MRLLGPPCLDFAEIFNSEAQQNTNNKTVVGIENNINVSLLSISKCKIFNNYYLFLLYNIICYRITF